MQLADVAKLGSLERFLYFVRERFQVFLRKRAGKPRPWTDDPILQSVYFTNVYREQDKVTTWFRDNIREPMRDDPGVMFATIAFRWFNWPATGDSLRCFSVGKPALPFGLFQRWDTKAAVRVLTALKEAGNQIFTGAYNISNGGSSKPKINRVCEDYIQPVWEANEKIKRDIFMPMVMGDTSLTLAEAHGYLSQLPGMGGSGFMAAQVVADLKYTAVLENASDWWTWCSPGPGSKKGLALLLGEKPSTSTGPRGDSGFSQEIEKLRQVMNRRFAGKMPPIHAQDVQNCLCEFFKMERARTEGGRTKRRYNGQADKA